jgi:hypothetical protein
MLPIYVYFTAVKPHSQITENGIEYIYTFYMINIIQCKNE